MVRINGRKSTQDGVVLPTNTDVSYDDPRKCRPIELSSDSDEAEVEVIVCSLFKRRKKKYQLHSWI